jgi:hypothetical protein
VNVAFAAWVVEMPSIPHLISHLVEFGVSDGVSVSQRAECCTKLATLANARSINLELLQ